MIITQSTCLSDAEHTYALLKSFAGLWRTSNKYKLCPTKIDRSLPRGLFCHEKLQDVLVGRGKSCSCFKIEIFPPCFCFLSSDNRTSLCPFVLPLSPSPPLPKKAACGFFHGFFYNLEKYFPFHKFSTPAVNNRTSPLVSLTPAVNRTSFCPSVLPPCPFFLPKKAACGFFHNFF